MFEGELAREAMFYSYDQEKDRVLCELCPHNCHIKEGKKGKCGVREHRDGKLITLNYGEVSSSALDPIEKKPLYHFYPGHEIFSIGTVGCNFSCSFCQNWAIAQDFEGIDTMSLTPEDVLEIMDKKIPLDRRLGVAYTYNEPTIWYEFIYDTARLIHKKDMKNVLVTNGFINKEPLEKLLPYIDAMNIDVKGFTEEFYKKYCKGRLEPVKEILERVHSHCHVEVTNLLIPGLNDSLEEIEGLVEWIARVNPHIPLHFSRYFPCYKMDLPPTPVETLVKAKEVADKKLSYVYLGNVRDIDAGHTNCPDCGEVVIRRAGSLIKNLGVEGKNCKFCGGKIHITGEVK